MHASKRLLTAGLVVAGILLLLWRLSPAASDTVTWLDVSSSRVRLRVDGQDITPPGVRPQEYAFGANNMLAISTDASDASLLVGTTSAVSAIAACRNVQCVEPTFSTADQTLSYIRLVPGADFAGDVMLLDRDGSLPRLAFASAPPLRTIQWSPDGTQIAGYAPSEDALMVLNRSSNDIVLLGENSGELYAWSPDSHKIALIRIRVLAEVATYQLLLADLQLGEVRALLPISANPITSLDWHPDGKSLAFSQFTLPETGGLAGRQIHLLTIATLAQRQLTTAADSTFGALSFSSNGERILTVRNRLTTPPLPPSVWMVNAATGELSFVADRATQPRWKRAQ